MAKILGISGVIGSGKSVVREALTVLYDFPSFDSDAVAKGVYFDKVVSYEIEQRLGFLPVQNGILDKVRLKETLAIPDRKMILEEIVHVAVARKFQEWIQQQSSTWIGIESAILFTSGFNRFCDFTVAVKASESNRCQRVLLRDKERSIEEFKRISSMQAEEGRREREEADMIIDNNGTSSITRAVETLWERITNM